MTRSQYMLDKSHRKNLNIAFQDAWDRHDRHTAEAIMADLLELDERITSYEKKQKLEQFGIKEVA